MTDRNYLDMSDEELMNAPEPVFEAPAAGSAAAGAEVELDAGAGAASEEELDEGDEGQGTEGAGEGEAADAGGEGSEGEGAADETGAKPGDEGKAAAELDKDGKEVVKDPATDEEKAKAKVEETAKDVVKVDFEAEYKRLLAPFKANGREIAVGNVDDAIALMQMGANYNKKMSALKPNLKLMKMLENSGFMNEERIGFLIDLGKKDPAAISKLVKESGIDPMDLDAEKASGYKPTTRTVDDAEIDLDTVLDDLQGSASYNRTLDIVSTKWDAASKQTVAKAPQLIRVINAHIESGIYDLIAKEVDSERVFGRLTGLTDIEAYRQVGDAIQARGGFNHLGGQTAAAGKPAVTTPVVITPKPKPDDAKLNEKRRAASSTAPVAPGSAAKDFNPLAMSDEEFSKQTNSKYL